MLHTDIIEKRVLDVCLFLDGYMENRHAWDPSGCADLAALQPLAGSLTLLDIGEGEGVSRHTAEHMQWVEFLAPLTRLTALRSLALPFNEPLGDMRASGASGAPPPNVLHTVQDCRSGSAHAARTACSFRDHQ